MVQILVEDPTEFLKKGLALVEDLAVLRVKPLSELGTPIELIKRFGGKDEYVKAVMLLETDLYDSAAEV